MPSALEKVLQNSVATEERQPGGVKCWEEIWGKKCVRRFSIGQHLNQMLPVRKIWQEFVVNIWHTCLSTIKLPAKYHYFSRLLGPIYCMGQFWPPPCCLFYFKIRRNVGFAKRPSSNVFWRRPNQIDIQVWFDLQDNPRCSFLTVDCCFLWLMFANNCGLCVKHCS